MKVEFPPIQDTSTNSDYPANPGATVVVPYVYNYKNNWIEAGQDAVEQIISNLGFNNADEFNAFYSIYAFNLLIKDPVGYIYSGVFTDRIYVKPTKYFVKQSVFSEFLMSSAQFSKSVFNTSDPADAYLYLFGRVTDNYSEAERFNHIRNWFINKTGIYTYTAPDKKYYDEEADLKVQFAKNKYLISWNPPRSQQQKFNPPPNKMSEPRSLNITAHVQYLITTFLAAYRKPPAEQDAAQLYQNEQGIISGLLGIRAYLEQSLANVATKASRSFKEFLYTGPAAKSPWTLNTYVDFGIEIPVATLVRAIEIDVGIWHAEWCVYNEGTNEAYIFKANCLTIGVGFGLINNKFGGKYLQYLNKNHSQKIMEIVNKLTPKAKKVLEQILSTNITLGRADLPFNVSIYETGGPITRDSFNGNLETSSISLAGAVAGVSSQALLISEEIAYAKPVPYINPRTGGNLPLPPKTSYTRPKAAILIEGVSNNNSLGVSINAQLGFGRCYTGAKVDYRKYLSWYN